MPEVLPFRALRFDPSAVGDLAAVACPPYDVIGPEDLPAYEGADPHNAVRLILPRAEPADAGPGERYRRARALLEAWCAAGVLRRDDAESLTLYEIRFTHRGAVRVLRGLLGAVRIAEPGEGGLVPHERTMPAPVEDRLALLRATGTNLEPIFAVYEGAPDPVRRLVAEAGGRPPLATFRDRTGAEHRAWRIDGPGAAAAAASLRPVPAIIADGHHRYATAAAYREERRASEGPGPWDHVLALLADAGDAGPLLLPIHRTVSGPGPDEALAALEKAFHVEPLPAGDPEAHAERLAADRAAGRAYVLCDAERAWRLTIADPRAEAEALPPDRSAAWRDLDVAVLHHLVLERLLGVGGSGYAHSATEAVEAVRSGAASLAFLLAPMPFAAVRAVAEAGDSMPPKSTYFFPKPLTGIALRPLD